MAHDASDGTLARSRISELMRHQWHLLCVIECPLSLFHATTTNCLSFYRDSCSEIASCYYSYSAFSDKDSVSDLHSQAVVQQD